MSAVLASSLVSLATPLIGILLTTVSAWAVAAYQTRTGVQLTDQQRLLADQARTALAGAAATGAGILSNRLLQGKLNATEIDPTHPAVIEQAVNALARVPQAAVQENMTVPAMAHVIAARVNIPETAVAVSPISTPVTTIGNDVPAPSGLWKRGPAA